MSGDASCDYEYSNSIVSEILFSILSLFFSKEEVEISNPIAWAKRMRERVLETE